MNRLNLIAVLLCSTHIMGCRTTSPDSSAKDTNYIKPVGEAPFDIPLELTPLESLQILPEGSDDLDQVRFGQHSLVFGINDRRIKNADYWDYYFPSFPRMMRNLVPNHCAQIVRNRGGSRLLMFHLANCPDDNSLLPVTTLRFYLLIDDDENNQRHGLNGFTSVPLHYKGFRVGSLHTKKVNDETITYIGDLCLSRGDQPPSGGSGAPDSISKLCDLVLLGDQLLDLKIRYEGRETKMLTGYVISPDSPEEVVEKRCIEENFPLFCEAVGDPTSSACGNAGLRTIACRECESACEAKFPL